MSHVRLQCRDAIVTAITGLATTGASVFKSVVYDIDRLTLPALIVRVGNESSQPVAFGRGARKVVYERDCEFDVVACAENNTDCDATLIGIVLEIETALAQAVGPWSTLSLIGSFPRLDGSAQKVRGQLILRYRASYQTRADAPDSTNV